MRELQYVWVTGVVLRKSQELLQYVANSKKETQSGTLIIDQNHRFMNIWSYRMNNLPWQWKIKVKMLSCCLIIYYSLFLSLFIICFIINIHNKNCTSSSEIIDFSWGLGMNNVQSSKRSVRKEYVLFSSVFIVQYWKFSLNFISIKEIMDKFFLSHI